MTPHVNKDCTIICLLMNQKENLTTKLFILNIQQRKFKIGYYIDVSDITLFKHDSTWNAYWHSFTRQTHRHLLEHCGSLNEEWPPQVHVFECLVPVTGNVLERIRRCGAKLPGVGFEVPKAIPMLCLLLSAFNLQLRYTLSATAHHECQPAVRLPIMMVMDASSEAL